MASRAYAIQDSRGGNLPLGWEICRFSIDHSTLWWGKCGVRSDDIAATYLPPVIHPYPPLRGPKPSEMGCVIHACMAESMEPELCLPYRRPANSSAHSRLGYRMRAEIHHIWARETTHDPAESHKPNTPDHLIAGAVLQPGYLRIRVVTHDFEPANRGEPALSKGTEDL